MRVNVGYLLLGAFASALGAIVLAGVIASNVLAAGPAAPASPPPPTFPVQLSQGDLGNLREICQLAQRNERLTLEQTTSVGTYCQDLLVRLGNALSTPATSAKPAEEHKP